MKKIYLIIFIFIGIFIIISLYKIIGPSNIFKSITQIPLYLLIISIILLLSMLFLSTLKCYLLIIELGEHISFSKLFSFFLAAYSLNQIIPSASLSGEIFKIILLKKNAGLNGRTTILSVILTKIVDLTVNIIFLVFAFFFLVINFKLNRNLKIILFLVILSFTVIFLLLYYLILYKQNFFKIFVNLFKLKKIKLLNSFNQDLEQIDEEISLFIRNKKKSLFILYILSILSFILFIYSYYIISKYIIPDMSFSSITVILVLSSLSNVIPIPASLGSFELSMVVLANLVGLSSEDGLIISFLNRIIESFFVVSGLLIISHFGFNLLFNLLKNTLFNYKEKIMFKNK